MQRIDTKTILKGNRVTLRVMTREDYPALLDVAKDIKIWEHYSFDITIPGRLQREWEEGEVQHQNGIRLTFVIIDNASNSIIGSTSYLGISSWNKSLEIGFTWLQRDYWGTGVNTECKLLLLTHCFEMLQLERVVIQTDELNIRSRKAIEKLGAQFEGIHRNDRLKDDGRYRSSAFYSILKAEWSNVKKGLEITS